MNSPTNERNSKMKFWNLRALKHTDSCPLSEDGFTLVEMLIVVAIIGGIMTLIGGNVFRQFSKARVDTTKIQMKQLGVALDDYRRECGFYPLSDQGLEALVKKPESGRECTNYDPEGYLKEKKLPKDAWGTAFLYKSDDGSKYTIISLGADKTEGGADVNKDISTDDVSESK